MSGIIINNEIIYTGPSWAAHSYSHADGPTDNEVSIGDMFATEFELSYGDNRQGWLPTVGASNRLCVEKIKLYQRKYINQTPPVIWILCDPVARIYYDEQTVRQTWPCYKDDIETEQWVTKLIHSPDWMTIRNELLHCDLSDMNDLGLPIGILGSHSDIDPLDVVNYENLTVIEPSWQNILCQEAGITGMVPNVGADFLHQTLKIHCKEKEITDHIKKNNMEQRNFWQPGKDTAVLMSLLMTKMWNWQSAQVNDVDESLVDYVFSQYAVWEQLEEAGLFNWVHPNILGNQIFYEHTKDKMWKFINDNI